MDFLEKENQNKNFIGAFCVTTGEEVEDFAKVYEKQNDDYTSQLSLKPLEIVLLKHWPKCYIIR